MSEEQNLNKNLEEQNKAQNDLLPDSSTWLERERELLNKISEYEAEISNDKQIINNLEQELKAQNDLVRDSSLWLEREQQVLNKISEYEAEISNDKQIIDNLGQKLKTSIAEKEELQGKVVQLQKDLDEINNTLNQNPKNGKNLLVEKNKICKNQELQIGALSQQIASLKEIVGITKDLLEVRNVEVKQLEDKIDIMEQKFNVEKEKHSLLNKKLDTMVQLNSDLKQEYETQLSLFTQLRESYKERQQLNDKVEQLSNGVTKPKNN